MLPNFFAADADSNLALKFANSLLSLSGGSIYLSLMLAKVGCIVMGTLFNPDSIAPLFARFFSTWAYRTTNGRRRLFAYRRFCG